MPNDNIKLYKQTTYLKASRSDERQTIKTTRGADRCNPGDYIIHHESGSRSVMDRVAFEATYEPVDVPADVDPETVHEVLTQPKDSLPTAGHPNEGADYKDIPAGNAGIKAGVAVPHGRGPKSAGRVGTSGPSGS